MSESLEKNLAESVHLSDADRSLLEAFRDGVGCKHKAELDCVTAQRDALRKAVEVYADTKNWKCSNCVHDVEHTDGICCNDFFEPTLDGYEIAREALAQQGGDEAMEIVRGE